jgi:hypothetical protein
VNGAVEPRVGLGVSVEQTGQLETKCRTSIVREKENQNRRRGQKGGLGVGHHEKHGSRVVPAQDVLMDTKRSDRGSTRLAHNDEKTRTYQGSTQPPLSPSNPS